MVLSTSGDSWSCKHICSILGGNREGYCCFNTDLPLDICSLFWTTWWPKTNSRGVLFPQFRQDGLLSSPNGNKCLPKSHRLHSHTHNIPPYFSSCFCNICVLCSFTSLLMLCFSFSLDLIWSKQLVNHLELLCSADNRPLRSVCVGDASLLQLRGFVVILLTTFLMTPCLQKPPLHRNRCTYIGSVQMAQKIGKHTFCNV